MGGGSAAQAPTQAPADTTPVDAMATPEVGGDPSSEVPFEKEPFDAGIEADENSDPKKYIEQLTGKLGQSLRTYTQKQGNPDFELEKFAINSLLSATHTSQMDSTDQADIIDKVETAGRSNDGGEDEPQGAESEPSNDDEPDNIFSTGDEEPAQDDDAMNEMALTDHNTQRIIKLYNNGDDRVRAELNALVSMRPNVSKEEFLKDLQDDVDYDELKYILDVLGKKGIELPDEENVAVYENESLFLENPPKNNMFQDGSNDKLKENLERSEKNGLFVKKSKIRPKINESLNQDDMNQPATAPVVKPTTKPETKPEQPKPSRKNKPFLPHVEPGTRTAPKAMDEDKHDYVVYHKTFSSAIQEAKKYVEAKGYQVNDDEFWNKISVGPAKPSDGKYNRYSLEITKNGKPQKKAFHIQVYNTGHNYELNCYVS